MFGILKALIGHKCMQEFLISLSTEHLLWAYLVIIIVAILEGPILSILLGIMIKLGYFPLIPTYIILMLGDLLGDVIWYGLGYFYGLPFVKRFGEYFDITPEKIKKVEAIFHHRKKSILIISKLTNGFGFAIVTLFTAGLVRIPFKTYFALNTLGQFMWTFLLVGAGYFFSDLYLTFDTVFARLSTIGLFGILVLMFLGVSRFVKKKMS